MMEIESGWLFYSADFSMKSAGKSSKGHVTLIRNLVQKSILLSMSDDMRDSIPLYVTGSGETVDMAICDANRLASYEQPLI